MLLSFQRPSRRSRGGLPLAGAQSTRLCGRTDQISTIRAPWGRPAQDHRVGPAGISRTAARRSLRSCPLDGATRDAAELAPPDLHDAPVQPARRDVELAGATARRPGSRLPGPAAAAPPSASRPTCSAMKAGRWHGRPAGDRRPRRSPRAGRPRRRRARSAPPPRPRPPRRGSARRCAARARAWRRAADGRRGGSSPSSSRYQLPIAVSGMRMRLAVLLLGRLGHADVVAERLRHLPLAVDAREDRHRQRDLLGLPVGALDVAAEQQVELLVGPSELDVGLHRHGVVALHERIEQLEDRDRLARRRSAWRSRRARGSAPRWSCARARRAPPSSCRATRS